MRIGCQLKALRNGLSERAVNHSQVFKVSIDSSIKNNEANAKGITVVETQFNFVRCKAIARGFFIRLTTCSI